MIFPVLQWKRKCIDQLQHVQQRPLRWSGLEHFCKERLREWDFFSLEHSWQGPASEYLQGGYVKDEARLFTEVKRWENEGQWSYIGTGEVLH